MKVINKIFIIIIFLFLNISAQSNENNDDKDIYEYVHHVFQAQSTYVDTLLLHRFCHEYYTGEYSELISKKLKTDYSIFIEEIKSKYFTISLLSYEFNRDKHRKAAIEYLIKSERESFIPLMDALSEGRSSDLDEYGDYNSSSEFEKIKRAYCQKKISYLIRLKDGMDDYLKDIIWKINYVEPNFEIDNHYSKLYLIDFLDFYNLWWGK